jgi:hypothetical protein
MKNNPSPFILLLDQSVKCGHTSKQTNNLFLLDSFLREREQQGKNPETSSPLLEKEKERKERKTCRGYVEIRIGVCFHVLYLLQSYLQYDWFYTKKLHRLSSHVLFT